MEKVISNLLYDSYMTWEYAAIEYVREFGMLWVLRSNTRYPLGRIYNDVGVDGELVLVPKPGMLTNKQTEEVFREIHGDPGILYHARDAFGGLLVLINMAASDGWELAGNVPLGEMGSTSMMRRRVEN